MNGHEWVEQMNQRFEQAALIVPTAKVLEVDVNEIVRSVASQTPNVRMKVTSSNRAVTVTTTGPGARAAQRQVSDRIKAARAKLEQTAREAARKSL